MQKNTLTLLFSLSISFIFGQSSQIEEKIQELKEIAANFSDNVISEEFCKKNWKNIKDFKDDIDEMEKLNIYKSEIDKEYLHLMSETADLFDDYFICVGGWNNFPISFERFQLGNKFFSNLQVQYIYKNEYCIEVIEYRLNDFICYLFVNNTSNDYVVNYEFYNSMSVSTGSMGLTTGMIRLAIDNRDGNRKVYNIKEITCKRL